MTTAHIVAHTSVAWGHLKPLIIFLGKVAERRPASSVVFTILTGVPALGKAQNEIARMPDSIARHFNLIDIGTPEVMMGPQFGLLPVFKDLWSGEAVTVLTGSTSINRTLPKPSVVLLDPMCTFVLPAVKDISGGQCPVIAWLSASLSYYVHLLGPEHLGGQGDLAAKIEVAAKESGKSPKEVANSVFKSLDGKVVRIPGMPPMFDYDFYPQEDIYPEPIGFIVQHWHRTVVECDGVMAVTTSALEQGAIDAWRNWLHSLGKEAYMIGPLETISAQAELLPAVSQVERSQQDRDILSFLDRMLAKHGARSVIYFAFGTVFFPKDPTKLYTFIDEMVSSGQPFLWGHASPFAKIPQDLQDKLAAAPNAFHANWIPQVDVLRHAATGWYISHCGWNGTQEALSLRVPIIAWPFGTDQPSVATLLSVVHRAAFELVAVRVGDGARQPYHLLNQPLVDFTIDGVRREVRDLLVKVKGIGGEEIRKNAENLGAAMDQSWNKGGEADMETEGFLTKYVD